MGDSILLTALGTVAKPCVYGLGNKSTTQRLAPLALLELLTEKPQRLIAVVTPEATATTLPFLRAGAAQFGCEVTVCDIATAKNAADVFHLVHQVCDVVPEHSRLTIDVTHGFRHFPFVVYVSSLYLSALKHAEIEHIFYGMYDASADGSPAPFVDLRALIDVPEWIHGIRTFTKYGDPSAITATFRDWERELRASAEAAANPRHVHMQASKNEKISESLATAGKAYLNGLPLEMGQAFNSLDHALQDYDTTAISERLPLAHGLMQRISEVARGLATQSRSRKSWRSRLQLDRVELARQAKLIERYIEHGHLSLSTGIMRELLVSWITFLRGESSQWLDYGAARKSAEHLLNYLAESTKNHTSSFGQLSDAQKTVGVFWDSLRAVRNQFAHHDMSPNNFSFDKVHNLIEKWRRLALLDLEMSCRVGNPEGKLLIAALGVKPGACFSALRLIKPDRGLILVSSETNSRMDELLLAAGFGNSSAISTLSLEDPHSGFGELDSLVSSARPMLFAAEEVHVSVTGGTTLMGIAVEKLARAAEQMHKSVRRYALVDRRTSAAQEHDPYQLGELFSVS